MSLSIRSNNIYITPEGQIKFSPIQMVTQQYTDNQLSQCQRLNINCNKIKFKKTFKLNDKLIVYEIKKIIHQMTKIWNPKSLEFKQIFRFVKAINSCNTVQQMYKFIYKPAIQNLNFSTKKTKSISTTQSTTKHHFKQSMTFSHSSESNNSKISVKKIIKTQKDLRPSTNYQPQIIFN